MKMLHGLFSQESKMKRTNVLIGICSSIIMFIGDIFPLWVTLGTKMIKSFVESITSVDADDPFYQVEAGVSVPAEVLLIIAILVFVLSIYAYTPGRRTPVRKYVTIQTLLCVLMAGSIVCECLLVSWVKGMEADYVDLYIAWPIIGAVLLVGKIALTITEARQMSQEATRPM